MDFMTKKIRSYNSFEFMIVQPPMISEWPPMYLVTECTTTSAPRSRGFVFTGDEKVLSTTRRTPVPFSSFAIAAMSKTFSVGFVGVSSQTSFVFG
jgi:hypothetical protein